VSVTVRVGVTDGSFSEVLAGELREGDLVITDIIAPKGASAPPGVGGGKGPGGGGPGGGMRRIL
jgi:hypothetical protein